MININQATVRSNKQEATASTLAYDALTIVLQQLMIPDLGWNMECMQKSSTKLRQEIVCNAVHKWSEEGMEDDKLNKSKHQLEEHLANDPMSTIDNLFDSTECALFESRIIQRRIQSSYLPSPTSVCISLSYMSIVISLM